MATRFQQPAINNLIAFEAAARTGSFTKAADELSISQTNGSTPADLSNGGASRGGGY